MKLFTKKKPVFDKARFDNNTKLLQQQLLDLTKSSMATDVVKVRSQNIINLLESPVINLQLNQMEILDGQLFNVLNILRDAIAQGLIQTTDEGLTTVQNLVITNRNQGKLFQMLEEVKASVDNLIEFTKIDLNQKDIDKVTNRLKQIKAMVEEKGKTISELQKNNLTREAKDLLNQRGNKEALIARLQASIRGRNNQLGVLKEKEDYKSMVQSQLLSLPKYKEAVADVQILKESIDKVQDEIDNVSEVYVDENLRKKDPKALTTSLEDLLQLVPDDEVKQSTPPTTVPSNTTKVTAKPQDDLSKLLEEIED
jgi:predicted nuclease with TOPRIM domain